MKVLISGGGIGGLATALCLAKFGHEAVVLEQAEAFREVGAGLQVSPNGMKVLRALGLEGPSRAAGFEPQRIEMRFGKSGQTIFTILLKDYAAQRWGAPFLQFHRADLFAVLAEAADAHPALELKLSSKVSGYDQSSEGVSVSLADGRNLSGDVLVGSDGIHSTVRAQMLGADKPEFTGCVAWRGTVPLERLKKNPPPPTACAWVGQGRHAVTYRLGAERLVNFVGVVEQKEFPEESWSAKGSRDALRRDFAGWHPVIQEIIEQGDDFFRWGLFGRQELPRWQEGRVAILGDAAHPMLPFLAQGAVMAIEDGWVLARCLSNEDVSVSDRLRMYEAVRKPRCTRVQSGARRNKTLFHLQNALLRAAIYGPMRFGSLMAPDLVHAQMDWIYGHDVTTCKRPARS